MLRSRFFVAGISHRKTLQMSRIVAQRPGGWSERGSSARHRSSVPTVLACDNKELVQKALGHERENDEHLHNDGGRPSSGWGHQEGVRFMTAWHSRVAASASSWYV